MSVRGKKTNVDVTDYRGVCYTGSCIIRSPFSDGFRKSINERNEEFFVSDPEHKANRLTSLSELFWMTERPTFEIPILKQILENVKLRSHDQEASPTSSHGSGGSEPEDENAADQARSFPKIDPIAPTEGVVFGTSIPTVNRKFAYSGTPPPETDKLGNSLYRMLMSGCGDGNSKRFFVHLYREFEKHLEQANRSLYNKMKFSTLAAGNESKEMLDKYFPRVVFFNRETKVAEHHRIVPDIVITSSEGRRKKGSDYQIFCIEVKSSYSNRTQCVEQLKVQLLSAVATHRNILNVRIGGLLLFPNSFIFMECRHYYRQRKVYVLRSDEIFFDEHPERLNIVFNILYQFLLFKMENSRKRSADAIS